MKPARPPRWFWLCAVLCLSEFHPVRAETKPGLPLALIPQVREAQAGPRVRLEAGLRIELMAHDAQAAFAADDLREWCTALAIPMTPAAGARVRLLRSADPVAQELLKKARLPWEPAMDLEGYALVGDGRGMTLIGKSDAGLFYAVQTVKQLLHHAEGGAFLQTVTARDWPAMRYRGFSDDVTRGGLPTMEFFKREIRTFAAYKLNVFSLYMQTTFRYRSMPAAAPHDGALTPAQAVELSGYAQRYHVTLIPEQESFAHLHTLLREQRFADVAETPLGGVLAPGQPDSLRMIGGWFSELAQAFPGPFLHIGADETFDLGKGQTKAAVQERGLAPVYTGFVLDIRRVLAPLHRRLLFWGDVALESPEQLRQIPKDMIAVTWVYEPHAEGYARWIAPFRGSGLETWVAPGVSNWRRVYPDEKEALENIQGLVAEGATAASTGVLNTAWNDDGEELPAMNWYGILFGAAAGWQPGRSDTAAFAGSFGPVFHGDGSGATGRAHQEMIEAVAGLRQDKALERSLQLFWLDPWSAAGHNVSQRIGPYLAALRTHAEAAAEFSLRAEEQPGVREQDALLALELGARKLDLLGLKFQAADRILLLYDQAQHLHDQPGQNKEVGELLRKIGGPGGLCLDLRDGYNETGQMYAELWSREYRPYALANIANRYRSAADLWQTRADWIMGVLLEYQRTGELAPLSAVPGMHGSVWQPAAR